jgi:hypothetical protein
MLWTIIGKKTVKIEIGDMHSVRKQGGLMINKSSKVIDKLLKEKIKFGFMDICGRWVLKVNLVIAFHYSFALAKPNNNPHPNYPRMGSPSFLNFCIQPLVTKRIRLHL